MYNLHMLENIDVPLVVELVNVYLERGDTVMVFAGKQLRGKLVSMTLLNKALPAPTYWGSSQPENDLPTCLSVSYIPAPKQLSKVSDPRTFKFTRKAVHFNIPVELVDEALTLAPLYDGVLMLNINTAVKLKR